MTQNRSTHQWLTNFTARLLQHYPDMNPLSAVKRAILMLPELDHLDAITAADQFAADPQQAHELVMRSRPQALRGSSGSAAAHF